jgi:hypothetical protein
MLKDQIEGSIRLDEHSKEIVNPHAKIGNSPIIIVIDNIHTNKMRRRIQSGEIRVNTNKNHRNQSQEEQNKAHPSRILKRRAA